MKLDQRIQQIQLILSDVDGVLTDGAITYDNNGIESVSYTHLTLPTINSV